MKKRPKKAQYRREGRIARKPVGGRKRRPALAVTLKETPAVAESPLPAYPPHVSAHGRRKKKKQYMSDTGRPESLPPLGHLCPACHQIIAPAELDVIDGMHGRCFDRQPFEEIARDQIAEKVQELISSYPPEEEGPHPDREQLAEMLSGFTSSEGSATNGRARRSIDALLRKMEAIHGTFRDISGQEALAAACLMAIANVRRLMKGHLPARRLSIRKKRYSLAVGRVTMVKRRADSVTAP